MGNLQLHSATKSFGKKTLLEEAYLSLETGEILGLFGRNGCGKSTLLKMLFGTVSGKMKLSIDGVTKDPSIIIKEQFIGYLPQHSFLPTHTKVRDIIPMYHNTEKKQDSIFYNSGVAKIAAKKIGELSHGERKYFEVVLIGNLDHPWLLLDEPFSMLEPLQTLALKQFLQHISPKKGILLTDHYYQDVLDITTKNMILKNGKTFLIETAEDLKKFEYLRK